MAEFSLFTSNESREYRERSVSRTRKDMTKIFAVNWNRIAYRKKKKNVNETCRESFAFISIQIRANGFYLITKSYSCGGESNDDDTPE